MSLLQKVKSGIGSPDPGCVNGRHPPSKTPVSALDMPEWIEITEQIDWWAKQQSQVACVSEDLKCWETWDITYGHKAKDIIDRLEERGVERGSARRSSLKGRGRNTVSQMNIGTVSRPTLGKTLRNLGFSERMDTVLNWSEQEKHIY